MLRFVGGVAFGVLISLISIVLMPSADSLLARFRTVIAEGREGPLFERARTLTAKTLFDPYTAKFEDLRAVETDTGTVVCGSVNAKNRMGAYVGAKSFVYQDITAFVVVDSDDAVRLAFKRLFGYCDPNYEKPLKEATGGNGDRK